MTRRYLWLFVIAVVAGVGASFAARGARPPAVAPPTAERPALAMTVTIGARDVVASTDRLPVGTRVTLTVTNASGARARLRLAGYEDIVDTGTLEAGETRATTFDADRPGDRFAWLIGEEPRGRLDITGSHLEEGHQ
jgi:hypothetical protein